MRRGNIGCLAVIGLLVAVILFFVSFGAAVRYESVAKLCTGKTKVETVHDAINAVRNLPGDWPFYELRHSNLFQTDGAGPDGGWQVRKWTEFPMIEGFEVVFELPKPLVEVECKVLACGAVDRCKTLGISEFYHPRYPLGGAR